MQENPKRPKQSTLKAQTSSSSALKKQHRKVKSIKPIKLNGRYQGSDTKIPKDHAHNLTLKMTYNRVTSDLDKSTYSNFDENLEYDTVYLKKKKPAHFKISSKSFDSRQSALKNHHKNSSKEPPHHPPNPPPKNIKSLNRIPSQLPHSKNPTSDFTHAAHLREKLHKESEAGRLNISAPEMFSPPTRNTSLVKPFKSIRASLGQDYDRFQSVSFSEENEAVRLDKIQALPDTEKKVKRCFEIIKSLSGENKCLKDVVTEMKMVVKAQRSEILSLQNEIDNLGLKRPKLLTGAHHYSKIIGIPKNRKQKDSEKEILTLKEEVKKLRKILNFYREQNGIHENSLVNFKNVNFFPEVSKDYENSDMMSASSTTENKIRRKNRANMTMNNLYKFQKTSKILQIANKEVLLERFGRQFKKLAQIETINELFDKAQDIISSTGN
ncbi:unnamed protein product [Moneuplotes crassus]|uniref:Uncharacterized protein n=1 Tax=Euplotes crassus TaxID=5936 RepID=A0AAD1X6S2_EUPCR|nr:unnamed protein product [Moneuplotes crassus]